MFRITTYLILFCLFFLSSCSSVTQNNETELKIIYTTDTHGSLLPYDFFKQETDSCSLANLSSYIKKQRQEYPGRLILLDGGDLIQGSPDMYYYNYQAIRNTHLASRVMNYLGYDAMTLGNHDFEPGEAVYYDHLPIQCKMSLLAANAIDTRTNEPMFKPYTIIERDGFKICVFGMITADTEHWLPRMLIPNLRFDPMIETARKWLPEIIKKEQPDYVIGMFHAGSEIVNRTDKNGIGYMDGSIPVAMSVRGIDMLLMGHDHAIRCDYLVNDYGDTIPVMQPNSHADEFGEIKLHLKRNLDGTVKSDVKMKRLKTKNFPIDKDYAKAFQGAIDSVNAYLDQPLGKVSTTLDGLGSLVGQTNLMDLIHTVQLSVTEAQISLTSTLSTFSDINKGSITMRNLFDMYKYENQVHKLWMTGRDVKNFLEYGYSRQFNQMTSANDHLLSFSVDNNGNVEVDHFGPKLKTPQYNFTSAAGINYIVDVSKPYGQRVVIKSMADGSKFELDKRYYVVMNSYQAAGGGGFLTNGLGWTKEDIKYHTITESTLDMRYYIASYIKEHGTIEPTKNGEWKVVPENWWKQNKERDKKIMEPYLK